MRRKMVKLYDAAKIRIPQEWKEPLAEIMKREGYTSIADLVRDMLRQKLREYGYLR